MLNPGEKIKELEDQGYTVFVEHWRYADKEGNLLPRGGATYVDIYWGSDPVGFGEAHCHKDDNYNKRLGLTIALGRAIKDQRHPAIIVV